MNLVFGGRTVDFHASPFADGFCPLFLLSLCFILLFKLASSFSLFRSVRFTVAYCIRTVHVLRAYFFNSITAPSMESYAALHHGFIRQIKWPTDDWLIILRPIFTSSLRLRYRRSAAFSQIRSERLLRHHAGRDAFQLTTSMRRDEASLSDFQFLTLTVWQMSVDCDHWSDEPLTALRLASGSTFLAILSDKR